MCVCVCEGESGFGLEKVVLFFKLGLFGRERALIANGGGRLGVYSRTKRRVDADKVVKVGGVLWYVLR